MAQTYLDVRNFSVFLIRLDPTDIRGAGSWARPVLHLPLQLQLTPAGNLNYTLLRLGGTLKTTGGEELAQFELPPFTEVCNPQAYYRPLGVDVVLDHARIRRFEDFRREANAHLSLSFAALLWIHGENSFQNSESRSALEVTVPRSHWADYVLPPWGLSTTKLIQVTFPTSEAGEHFRAAYARLEAAEKLFANGLYKQVFAEIYSAFEGLAKSQNFERADQQFFAHLFADFHSLKKERAKLALDYFCSFLQLGRHEPKDSPDTFAVSRSDARFALTMAHVVFEYITPAG